MDGESSTLQGELCNLIQDKSGSEDNLSVYGKLPVYLLPPAELVTIFFQRGSDCPNGPGIIPIRFCMMTTTKPMKVSKRSLYQLDGNGIRSISSRQRQLSIHCT